MGLSTPRSQPTLTELKGTEPASEGFPVSVQGGLKLAATGIHGLPGRTFGLAALAFPLCLSAGRDHKIPQIVWLKQQKLVSHSSGGGESKIEVPARSLLSLVRRLPCACCVLTGGKSGQSQLSCHQSRRVVSPSGQNHLPKAPSRNSISLGIRASTCGFGGQGRGVMPTRSPARSPCPLIPGPLPEGDKREPCVPSAALCPGRAPARLPTLRGHGFPAPRELRSGS